MYLGSVFSFMALKIGHRFEKAHIRLMTEKVESIDIGLIQDQIMLVKFCVHWSPKSGIYLT